MAEFSDGFLPLIPPDRERTVQVLKSGLVVVDTNVLLDAYRYTQAARLELFSALKALGDRLWIPHQVALEFHRNRLNVIASHGDAYSEVAKAVAEFRKSYDAAAVQQLRKFINRVALNEDAAAELLETASSVGVALGKLTERINELQAAHGVSDRFLRSDPVLEELQTLFSGRVGEPLPPEEMEVARQEAEERVRTGRPPGFKDASKDDPCGDYLLWHQSLLEAKRRALPFILVTRDGKADWFLEIRGKSVGALPELVKEAFAFTGADFIALETKTFLIYAQSEFNAQVSVATLAQTDAIRSNAKRRKDAFVHFPPAAVDELKIVLERELEAHQRARETLRARIDFLRTVQRSETSESGSVGKEVETRDLHHEEMTLTNLEYATHTYAELLHVLSLPDHDHGSEVVAFPLLPSQIDMIRQVENSVGRKFIPRDPDFWRRKSAADLKDALRAGDMSLDKLSIFEMRTILRDAKMLPLGAVTGSWLRKQVLALLAAEESGGEPADSVPDAE
ncbi:PIN domain-containing protein [Dactylosporangium sp. NPDC051485]|uniref:PIN-like domain-containing protein n=1 Tax=Dactylosporangium sp. NPDC051485 TaxID=3154846 RepID=UPI00341715D3